MTITLYDICSTTPGRSTSANLWKVRYSLNLKGIAHKTEWLEFANIEPFYKTHGITPTVTKADGTPRYTLPLIYDPASKRYIPDSFAIAQYLDDTYPGPKIFPHGTAALQLHLEDAYIQHIRAGMSHTLPKAMETLTPVSLAFFKARMAAAASGAPAEEVVPRDVQWDQFRQGLSKVDEWYAKADGPFLMGDTVSWGDIMIASYLVWFRKNLGEESEEWRDIASWNGGRWAELVKALHKYELTF